MLPRSTVFLARVIVLSALASLSSASAQGQPEPFQPSRDRASWDARREVLRAELDEVLGRGLPERPSKPRLETRSAEPFPPLTPQPFTIDTGDGVVGGILVEPVATGPVPLILLVVDPATKALTSAEGRGYDGRPPALLLARFGFAVLVLDGNPSGPAQIRNLRVALDAGLARPGVDPKRVGVVGFGPAGPVALALMAVEPRIACGVTTIELDNRRAIASTFRAEVVSSFHGPSFLERLAALCAPRPLSLLVGERLPLPTPSSGRSLERTTRNTFKLYGDEGQGLAFTLFGEFPGHESVSTRLQWMAGLEQLDKRFRPQGPTPLGHAPEPEPELGGDALELTKHGIAGWAAEMSQRPVTWTWSNGVITCKPGLNEYGWLRAPIEVGDFLLRVDWKVPEKGNVGIFLRARPVEWHVPPGPESKPRVQMYGLDWPSRAGLELQAQADPGEASRYSSGSLYRHAAPSANPTHPPGQWNRYTVRARGTRVEVWINGQQVMDTRLESCSDTLPEPPLRGYIGLQNHGASAEYRDVRLIRLGE